MEIVRFVVVGFIRKNNTMKKLIPALLLLPLVAWLNGCAAGAATAGWASKAGTADGLTAEGTKLVLDSSKAQSDVYTDSSVLKLEGKVLRQIQMLELRIEKLELKQDTP